MKFVSLLLAISLLTISFIAAQNGGSKPVLNDFIAPDSIFYDLADLDQPPSFPGGQPEWTEYLGKLFKRPPVAPDEQRSAVVKMTFIVEKDGSISNKRVLHSSGPLLYAILGAIDQMPCWLPGMKNGQPVRVWYYLPVHSCME